MSRGGDISHLNPENLSGNSYIFYLVNCLVCGQGLSTFFTADCCSVIRHSLQSEKSQDSLGQALSNHLAVCALLEEFQVLGVA